MWDVEPINHELIFKDFLARYLAGPKAVPIQDYDLHYRNSDQRLMIMSNCTTGYPRFEKIAGDNAFIIGHTSNPEFEKLRNDPTMEALRDRTVKVEVPTITLDEIRQKRYNLIARVHYENLENARCQGKLTANPDDIKTFHNKIKLNKAWYRIGPPGSIKEVKNARDTKRADGQCLQPDS